MNILPVSVPLRRNAAPEGVLYRRGLTALAAGSLFMSLCVASESHGTGAAGSAEACAYALAGILAAAAAMFITAYTRTVPSLLKVGYAHRHGSLAGWNGHREAADALAGERARTGLGKLLVRVRNGTWNDGGEIS